MSGLVFVQDASGRPLMPTSPALARTLRRSGKAIRRPHPAFTVIRLTQDVPDPVLRPVLLGISLYQRTAELIVLADRAKGPPFYTFVIVDLLKAVSWYGRRPRRAWISQSHYAFNSQRTAVRSSQHRFSLMREKNPRRWRIHILAAAISSIQQFIPITHMIVIPTLPIRNAIAGSRRWTARKLVSVLIKVEKPIMLLERMPESHIETEALHGLYQALVRVVMRVRHEFPRVVARHLVMSEHRLSDADRQQRDGLRWARFMSQRVLDTTVPGERLCTVWSKGRAVTGLLKAQQSAGWYLLEVPIDAGPNGVTWQRIRIHADRPIQLWSVSSLMMIPLLGINEMAKLQVVA